MCASGSSARTIRWCRHGRQGRHDRARRMGETVQRRPRSTMSRSRGGRFDFRTRVDCSATLTWMSAIGPMEPAVGQATSRDPAVSRRRAPPHVRERPLVEGRTPRSVAPRARPGVRRRIVAVSSLIAVMMLELLVSATVAIGARSFSKRPTSPRPDAARRPHCRRSQTPRASCPARVHAGRA